jgi:hypothetical protein
VDRRIVHPASLDLDAPGRRDSLPYVSVGSGVTPTTVVFLIEAMRIFHEIVGDCSGIVPQVLVNDRAAVDYGKSLFRVVPTAPTEAWGGAENGPVALVREVFDNPFRGNALASSLSGWNGGALVKLPNASYDLRRLPEGTLDRSRLAVLADALEEAGCADAGILRHCRRPGEHLRGYWALDLVLGKACMRLPPRRR